MADVAGADPPRPPRGPAFSIAAAMAVVYVVWHAVDLIVLGFDPELFNRVHRLSGGFVPRLAVALVAVGVLAHATAGLVRAVVDLWPALDRHRLALEALARFVTPAVGIPTAAVIVWPAIQAWWSR